MDWNRFVEFFADSELDGNKIIIKSQLHEVIQFVKDNYPYDILQEIIAVETPEGLFELTYHLFSTEDEEDLLISIVVENEAESVTDIFESAIADENEIYDMFGILFIGNEDLKRLYMPENWNGHPMRKDYVQDDTRLCWNDDDHA